MGKMFAPFYDPKTLTWVIPRKLVVHRPVRGYVEAPTLNELLRLLPRGSMILNYRPKAYKETPILPLPPPSPYTPPPYEPPKLVVMVRAGRQRLSAEARRVIRKRKRYSRDMIARPKSQIVQQGGTLERATREPSNREMEIYSLHAESGRTFGQIAEVQRGKGEDVTAEDVERTFRATKRRLAALNLA